MQLIFWQNIFSPHQIPYIKELRKDIRVTSVTLIIAELMEFERSEMGWDVTNSDQDSFLCIVKPDRAVIERIYLDSTSDTFHFYSGITAFPFVFDSFKIGLKYPIKRGIIVEPPFVYRKPLPLHFVKTLIFEYRYYKSIDYVFAMGSSAIEWYKYWQKRWKVFEFAYCVEPPQYSNTIKQDQIDLVFIGSLVPRKNVSLLINSMQAFSNTNIKLHIIGDGIEKGKLLSLTESLGLADVVTFHGVMNMSDIHKEMTNYDILVLPSHFDGWGAVVNEAIMAGLYVVCSDKCGSKSLINSLTGQVFSLKNKSLIKVLNNCIENIDTIRCSKLARNEWSKKISGESVAKYFIDCLDSNDHVTPPWK